MGYPRGHNPGGKIQNIQKGVASTLASKEIYMCTINFTEKSFKIKQNLTEKGVAAVHLANP